MKLALFRSSLLICAVSLALAGFTPVAGAQSSGVVAIVNDSPITARDIDQRQRLMKTFGDTVTRKEALELLINDVVKETEGRKLNVAVDDATVDQQIKAFSKGKPDEFMDRFRKQGVSDKSVRRFVASNAAFMRIFRAKYPTKTVKVDPATVDRLYKEALAQYNAAVNDPRMKPVMVYTLLEIDFPVDALDDASAGALLQSRTVEVQTYLERFKGCSKARAAASGIFNVRIGKPMEADASKLPPQMKSAMDRAGVGKAVGPARSKDGLQVYAFCSKRTISPPAPPPPPTRDRFEGTAENQAFDVEEKQMMAELRKASIIEYRTPEFTP